MPEKHEHDYRKLNNEAVFCRGCGDIKTVEPPVCVLPHWPVQPTWVPIPNYYPWWGTYTVVSGGTTYTPTDTVYMTNAQFDAASSLIGGSHD